LEVVRYHVAGEAERLLRPRANRGAKHRVGSEAAASMPRASGRRPAIGSAGAVTFVTKCSDVRQPGAAAIVATTDDREEQLLEAARRRTGLAVADAAIVELADRRHLRGRAGEERLVGEIYLVAGEALLTAGDAELGEELEDGVARDAAEHGRQRRGLGDAARDDEHVLAARLGHVAVHVEQQGLVVARAPDLVRGEDRVHVVAAGLGLGEQRVRVEALEGAGLHADAGPESLVQRVREHVDLRLVPGDEPPVEPDPLGLLHRPPASPKPSRNANYVAAAPSRRS